MSAGVHHSEDKLLDFVYGELPAPEAATVDAHVRTCAKCGQSLAQIRGVRQVFSPLPMVAAPEAGLESLLAYAEQHARRAREAKSPRWRRWVAAFASAAALLVVGVVALRASEEAPPSAASTVLGDEAVRRKARSEDEFSDKQAKAVARAEAVQAQEAAKEGARPRDVGPPSPPSAVAANEPSPPPNDRGAASREVQGEDSPAAKRPSPEAANALKVTAANKQLDVFADSSTAVPVERKSESKRGASIDGLGTGTGLEGTSGKVAAGLREDFSNARGGQAPGAQPLAEKDARLDQLNDGTSVKQSMVGTAAGPLGLSTGRVPTANEPSVQLGDARGSPAEASPPTSLPPAAPEVAPKPISMPSKPQKGVGGYGLGSAMQRSNAEAMTGDESDDAKPRAKAEVAERVADRQLDVDASLASARALSKVGDRRGEIAAAVKALSAGATGYARAEALKRACDAHEVLGEFDRAQQYCDVLLAEFPSSAAARAVVDRRRVNAAPGKRAIDTEARQRSSAPSKAKEVPSSTERAQ